MNSDPNVRTVMLVTALAAVAATAWATNESFPHTTWTYESDTLDASEAPAQEELAPPESSMVNAPEATTASEPANDSEPVDAVPSNAHVPAASEPPPAIDPKVEAPAQTRVEPEALQSPITIERRRLTVDERIQGNVMDIILSNAANLSGRIGVESQDAVVTLTGYTTTAGQAQRAGRYAASVEGVKAVQNQIRPRVGGSV